MSARFFYQIMYQYGSFNWYASYFPSLFVCLTVCLSVCLLVCLSFCLCVSIALSTSLSFSPPSLSLHLSLSLFSVAFYISLSHCYHSSLSLCLSYSHPLLLLSHASLTALPDIFPCNFFKYSQLVSRKSHLYDYPSFHRTIDCSSII